jgi:hypothetical protein
MKVPFPYFKENAMEIGNPSLAAASAQALQNVQIAASLAVLQKSMAVQAEGAAMLVNSLPAPAAAPQPSTSPTHGGYIDTYA